MTDYICDNVECERHVRPLHVATDTTAHMQVHDELKLSAEPMSADDLAALSFQVVEVERKAIFVRRGGVLRRMWLCGRCASAVALVAEFKR